MLHNTTNCIPFRLMHQVDHYDLLRSQVTWSPGSAYITSQYKMLLEHHGIGDIWSENIWGLKKCDVHTEILKSTGYLFFLFL